MKLTWIVELAFYASVGFIIFATVGLFDTRYCMDWHGIPKTYKCTQIEYMLRHGG